MTPAEIERLQTTNLQAVSVVVFDVLRATSSILSALSAGAEAIIPVTSIEEAIEIKRREPSVLLAGERNGLRITSEISGGIEFDFGNSPREFKSQRVNGRKIVITTTNGSVALKTCSGAENVFVSAFMNIGATAELILRRKPKNLLIVCSGTYSGLAFEDVLAAGALCNRLPAEKIELTDSAHIALDTFLYNKQDLRAAICAKSKNAKRLLSIPALADDVDFCLQTDLFDFSAVYKNHEIRITSL